MGRRREFFASKIIVAVLWFCIAFQELLFKLFIEFAQVFN